MEKKVYIVSYSSYYDEIYMEVKVCNSKEEAQKVFDNYIEDIAESISDEDTAEELIENYKGASVCDYRIYGGAEFLVQMTES